MPLFITRLLYSTLTACWVAVVLSAQSASAPGATEQFDQTKALADLRQRIAGRETLPAEDVFLNIQDYKGVPASGLLRGMEFYTRALGVTCLHCHTPDKWEADTKPTKQIAREMSQLVDVIQARLAAIKNLQTPRPGISCETCHRGRPRPGRPGIVDASERGT
jgi:hypothetical protein